MHITAHNPWYALHYATTGLNIFEQQINPGQQITRQQALRAYTRGNAWYLSREHDLGSIEKGKLADLVVLDKDYFTVSDAEARRIRPVLTLVDGRVVHTWPAQRAPEPSRFRNPPPRSARSWGWQRGSISQNVANPEVTARERSRHGRVH